MNKEKKIYSSRCGKMPPCCFLSGSSRAKLDMNQDYVLVTAALNEENYIPFPIRSVIAQTILPKKWVIVSDGSTDGTDRIVAKYAEAFEFIELVRAEEGDTGPNFASKVRAIQVGYGRLRGLTYSYIGNLDADVS